MHEEIAIVGMACRVPGASTVDGYWRLMMDGADPIERTESGRRRGRLPGVEMFNAAFFDISPREARSMDPQQRLLLETVHDAVQDAGLLAARLAGTDTGVFVGQHTDDYGTLMAVAGADGCMHAMMGSGARSLTSGRISFAFDLRGPSITLDAACSSSLVGVHLAVQAIRSGECSTAIVGAANVVLLPTMEQALDDAGMLAADGRCKFGDALADGFVRSEGVGAVVLKPLADARRDGDRVRAIVLGSAVTSDGRGSGSVATPAVDGQERMLRNAYRDAGVDPVEVDYVEVHGAGTPVGDRVELTALSRVVGPDRPADRPCLVGSGKATIGHTESAAGLVGLIRSVLCLEHATVPPNPRLGDLNPVVPWSEWGLRLPRPTTALPVRCRPHVAGVSSFGLSGTNAHVVLSAAERQVRAEATAEGDAALLVVSARDPEALDELAVRWRSHLRPEGTGHGDGLPALARAAVLDRDHHEHRLAVVATSCAEAAARLDDVLARRTHRGAVRGDGPVADPPRVAFVFPGQGPRWTGMGRELLRSEPAFADAMTQCDAMVQAEAGWSVLDHLTGPRADGAWGIDVVQPVLWSMQVALAALWRSWGVEPDVVLGHSMGEVAAAQVAGVLTTADAAAVICRRSRLARRVSGRGGMALVELSEQEAAAVAAEVGPAVCVAASNGPRATVLSGDTAALDAVLMRLDRDDVFTRHIETSIASHSPQMDALRGDLRAALADVAPTAGTVPLRSTVVGERIDGAEMNADYWVANLRRPVRFLPAVRAELAAGGTVFVEISPHPLLTGAIDDAVAGSAAHGRAVGSLRRGEPERATMLASLAALYVSGARVTPHAAAGRSTARATGLPTYPWHRTAYWFDGSGPAPARHPLLGVEEAPAVAAPPLRDLVAAGGAIRSTPPAVTVRGHAAAVLGMGADELPVDRALHRAGMDSLMAAELRVAIDRATGVRLPIRLLLGAATVASLDTAVRERLAEDRPVPAVAG